MQDQQDGMRRPAKLVESNFGQAGTPPLCSSSSTESHRRLFRMPTPLAAKPPFSLAFFFFFSSLLGFWSLLPFPSRHGERPCACHTSRARWRRISSFTCDLPCVFFFFFVINIIISFSLIIRLCDALNVNWRTPAFELQHAQIATRGRRMCRFGIAPR